MHTVSACMSDAHSHQNDNINITTIRACNFACHEDLIDVLKEGLVLNFSVCE
jgi:hypothetical protein